jgi:hypothetical protein
MNLTTKGNNMIAIYIDAGRDRNGNPKRGWIITNDDGEFTDFVNEGYLGHVALKKAGYQLPSTGEPVNIDVIAWDRGDAKAWGIEESYDEDPDASVSQRIVVRAEDLGRIA